MIQILILNYIIYLVVLTMNSFFFLSLLSTGCLFKNIMEGHQAFISHVWFFLNQAITVSFNNSYLKVYLKESS